MTNKDKLMAWDVEFYNSLSDDVCFICLSEKEIYIVGQVLRQVQWRTRWHGDSSALDLIGIAGELSDKLATKVSCDTLNQILNSIIILQSKIYDIDVEVQNIKNSTNYEHPNGITADTIVDEDSYETGVDDIVYTLPASCSDSASKDALWGACLEVAEQLVQSCTDFFEQTAQSTQGFEIADNIVSAIPLLETLPIDELIGLADWVTNEAETTWNALVTDERIKDFACLLFCYASVHNDCQLSPLDIFSVVNANAASGSELIGVGIRDFIAFIVSGNLIGNDFFYGVIGWQLAVRAMGQEWLGSRGTTSVKRWIAAGFNSPDSDWSIFCVDCGTTNYYRIIEADFSSNILPSEWERVNGTLTGLGILGEDQIGNDITVAYMRYLTSPSQSFTPLRVEYSYSRSGIGTPHGQKDFAHAIYKPDDVQAWYPAEQHNHDGNGDFDRCESTAVYTPAQGVTIGIGFRVSAQYNAGAGSILLKSCKVWMPANSSVGKLVTDNLPC